MSTQDEIYRPKSGPERQVQNPRAPEKQTHFQMPVYHEGAAAPEVDHLAFLLANAEVLIRHREIDAARNLIYRALAQNSKHPMALKLAARLLNPERDGAKLVQIQRTICTVEYCFETVSELAHLLYREGQDADALDQYYECLSLVFDASSDLFEVFKNMGNILTKMGDFDGAEEHYNKAFTVNAESDVLLVNLGTLSLQRQDFNQALTRFRSAVQINSRNDKGWVGLALVHQSMGDLELALGNLDTALDINPANRTATQLFASWAIRDGKVNLAIERIKDYLALVDVDVDLSILLIQLFCQMYQLDLASLELERVLLWEPEHQQLQQVEGEIRTLRESQAKQAKEIQ